MLSILDSEDTVSGNRLKLFIHTHRTGGCRCFSVGEACICALCDVDRLQLVVMKARAVLAAITAADETLGVGDRVCTENFAIKELAEALRRVAVAPPHPAAGNCEEGS